MPDMLNTLCAEYIVLFMCYTQACGVQSMHCAVFHMCCMCCVCLALGMLSAQ